MKKERPILFSTEMVRAIQEGRKTQTRRTVKLKSIKNPVCLQFHSNMFPRYVFEDTELNHGYIIDCPYGKPGDILWVREKFRKLVNCQTGEESFDFYAEMPDDFHEKYPHSWKPSIHMPKDAARIWLEITNVRVERLMDINRYDAIAEGISKDPVNSARYVNYVEGSSTYNERTSFYSLWESINGKESLDSNPWVWVVEFKRIEKP